MKKIIVMMLTLIVVSSSVHADTADQHYCKNTGDECQWNEMTLEEQAEVKGMTVEAYEVALGTYKKNRGKVSEEAFLKELEEKDMTLEDYKALVLEKYEKMAEAKGMTLEALKASLKSKKGIDKKRKHCYK